MTEPSVNLIISDANLYTRHEGVHSEHKVQNRKSVTSWFCFYGLNSNTVVNSTLRPNKEEKGKEEKTEYKFL